MPPKVAEPSVAYSNSEIAVEPLFTSVGNVRFHHLNPVREAPLSGSAPAGDLDFDRLGDQGSRQRVVTVANRERMEVLSPPDSHTKQFLVPR